MGRLLGLHEISVIGGTTNVTTTGTSQATELLSDATKNGPARFLLMCTEEVYLLMGDSAVVADADDMRLPADTSMVVTVTLREHSFLAALQVSTSGVLKITRLDDEKP